MDNKKKKFYRPKQKPLAIASKSAKNQAQHQAERISEPMVADNPAQLPVKSEPFLVQPLVPRFNEPTPPQFNRNPQPQRNTAQTTASQTPLQTTQPGIDPNLLYSAIMNSPTLARIQQNQADITRLTEMEKTIGDTDGRSMSAAQAGMSGFGQVFNPNRPDVVGAAAYAGGRALAGALFPKWNEKEQIRQEIAKRYQENELLRPQVEQEFNMQRQAAQFGLQVDKERQDRAEFENRQRLADDKFLEQKRTNFFKRYRTFNPATASESQRRELAEFGETPESVGQYDFTNPTLKTVNGVIYQYNPLNQTFEESNLPKDQSQSIVDYEVVDSTTGVTYKFAVPAVRAAQFKTSLEAQKMAIKAATERQVTQQNWQSTENEKNRQNQRQMQVERIAADTQQWKAQLAVKFANDQQGYVRELQNQITKWTTAKNKGELTEEELNFLLNTLK